MTIRLEEWINASATADWRRRKAEEYPDDSRNLEAAVLLERLHDDLVALNSPEKHLRLEKLLEEHDYRFSEVINEELKSVGFHSFPETGVELLERIASRLDA